MFGISATHLIILGVVLLIFGPKRLPGIGHQIGQGIKNFRDALAGVQEASYRRVDEKKADAAPPPNEDRTV